MPVDIIVGRDEADMKKFGKEALVPIGKTYVKMGRTTSLTNPILMDVARSHVVLISGKRGSGKSYTLGVLAEEMASLPEEVASNIAVLIFDTMGIFWTMSKPNEKEEELLRSWGLQAKKIPVRIFVPFGFAPAYRKKGIPVTANFAIEPTELNIDDWIVTFGIDFLSPPAILITRAVTSLKERKRRFDIDSIIKVIQQDKEASREARGAAVNLMEGAKAWGVFTEKGAKGTKIRELIEGGKTSILDLSCYSAIGAFNIRALVISLVCKKLFNERMAARRHEEVEAVRHGMEYLEYKEKREMPIVWLFFDEMHEFIPKEGRTPATDALIQLLREGRQPGISMVMATQQPGVLSPVALTQSDMIISHRVTAKPDIDALNAIMQTYLREAIQTHINNLPRLKGSAIILDDNSERIYPMRIHPRFTWHGGEAPTTVKVKKRL